MATRVQLTAPGPYETPIVEGFVGLAISQGRLPVQIRLVVRGGIELHLPSEDIVLERLYGALHELYGATQKSSGADE